MSREAILAEIERSRLAIRRDFAELKREADFPAKMRESIRKHSVPWLGGATITGWLLAGRKRRPKRSKRKDAAPEPVKKLTVLSIIIAAVRFLMPLWRPVLSAYAAKRLGDFASRLAK